MARRMTGKPGPGGKADLPPCFNIDPAPAAAKLARPIGTARLAKAAAIAARGRDDLARRGYAPDGRKRLGRFSTWGVCKYLIPVNPAHLLRVLWQTPDLPQGEGKAGSKWFTLADILTLRDHFTQEGAKDREYRAWRPDGLPAKDVVVAEFTGGVGKTSTAPHLAMSAGWTAIACRWSISTQPGVDDLDHGRPGRG